MNKIALSQISQTRLEILKLSKNLSSLLSQLVKINKITKGTIFTKKRKCGHLTCKCAKGELHSTIALCRSQNGKSKTIGLEKFSVPDLAKIKNQVKHYQRFRRIRAKIVADYQVLIKSLRFYEKSISIDVPQLSRMKGDRHDKKSA